MCRDKLVHYYKDSGTHTQKKRENNQDWIRINKARVLFKRNTEIVFLNAFLNIFNLLLFNSSLAPGQAPPSLYLGEFFLFYFILFHPKIYNVFNSQPLEEDNRSRS